MQGEDAGGGGGQLFVRGRGIIELSRATKNDAAELPLLAGRKPLEFFKQMRGRCAHAEKIIRLFSRASWKMCGLGAYPLDFPGPDGLERLRRDRRGSALAFHAGTRQLRRLYETLQLEIISVIESVNQLRESPDYELCQLSGQKAGVLDELASERAGLLDQESAELEKQAERLAEEIKELTGKPAVGIR